jgi:inorganic pyrophosphatase
MQETQKNETFWQALNTLVKTSNIVIDRPQGTTHPRYPEFLYPLDYGYLQGTHSGDGDGIDIWLGSLPERVVTAVIITVDLRKRDSEMKILLGCTQEEMQSLLAIHRRGQQSAILIESL